MYEKKFQINSNDVDSNLELRLSNLFRYMQDVASEHSAFFHASHSELKELNYAWVVFRFEVRLFKMPKLDEEIIVSTHPGDKRAFMYPRFFEFYDSNRNLIGASSSMWAIIDRSTRKVVISPRGVGEIPGESESNDIPLPDRIKDDADIFLEDRKVRYSEIDLNGHLNNTQYVEYIMDTHEPSFYKSHRIKQINIDYDKEIREGDVISLFTNDEEIEIIKGTSGDTRNFIAKIVYESR